MRLWTPEIIEVGEDLSALDGALEPVPNRPAVFLVWPHEGLPYLARTTLLRRRLLRLLGERSGTSRWLNLRPVVSRVEYRLTASWLETSLVFYGQARQHFPDTYLKLMKLRMPSYVKIILSNAFPRSQITTRVGGARAFYYGPFRSRLSAEQFEGRLLDLFQMRRCQEDLAPSPEHPGCIYGEMNMCLRPCQQIVGREEYDTEVNRVLDFLRTEGKSLLDSLKRARERLSEEMNFEEAAWQHKQIEKVEQVLKLRDDLAYDLNRLCGVAITPSVAEDCVELWFMLGGCWQPPQRFRFEVIEGKTVSLDHRLRELAASLEPRKVTTRERQEHMALLARWRYSSWTDGEWIAFRSLEEMPYRKVVNAIARVAKRQ